MAGDLKDWLWRLDCIQKEIERLLPERNLHVAFSLKIDQHGSTLDKLSSFPLGQAIQGVQTCLQNYFDPETLTFSFDLGADGFKPCVVCWDYHAGWSMPQGMPEAFFDKGEDELFITELGTWCVLYYFKGDSIPAEAEWGRIANSLANIDQAILETCAVAPDTVSKALGNAAGQECWATALFLLTLRWAHPLLRAFGKHIPRNLDPQSSFAGLDDLLIRLSPDLHTATVYAFEVFRQVADAAVGVPPADEEELSLPMSLTEMSNRLGNMSPEKFKEVALNHWGLTNLSRQKWQVRLDLMDKGTRHRIEHGKPLR